MPLQGSAKCAVMLSLNLILGGSQQLLQAHDHAALLADSRAVCLLHNSLQITQTSVLSGLLCGLNAGSALCCGSVPNISMQH